MKIIAIASQKGGVGKTTLAVNIASGLQTKDFKVALFDMDNQESATAWSERRQDENLHVEPVSARRLGQFVGVAEAEGFDVVVIDTPPAAGTEAAEAVQLSDLVIIPCRPSLPDLDAIKRTATLVQSCGKRGYVVINAAPPTAVALIGDAKTLAGQTGLGIAPVVIRERTSFRASWPVGMGVLEHEPDGKAAAELTELLDFIIDDLKIAKPAKQQQRKRA